MDVQCAPRIRQGGVISVVAPGSPVKDPEALRRGMRLLESLGFRVRQGGNLYDRHFLYAGRDEVRAEEVNRSFSDPSVSALFCARGGAGSLRILPLLEYDAIAGNKKVFVGYSDTTAIQVALLARSGLVSFYGPMVETDLGAAHPAPRRRQLFDLLKGREESLELDGSGSDEVLTLYPGQASGRLVGGCLSVFASLLGTAYEPDTAGAILFFEDVDEYVHRIDRYLAQLHLAGKLRHARGVVFGSFGRSSYPCRHEYHDFQPSLIELLEDWATSLEIPCIYGLPFGHVPDPYTLPVGGSAHLDATRKRLILERCVL